MASSSGGAPSGWIHRPTLLPGRTLAPLVIYYGLVRGVRGFLLGVAFTTYGLYVVRGAALSPFQLVLVGTAVEVSTLLSEVPTGAIADVVSRRLSVVLHFVIVGLSFIVMGTPTFPLVLLGSAISGVGWALGSGAEQAWLSDEIGEVDAGRAFVRGAQVREVGWLLGVPFGVLLSNVSLSVPLVAAGILLVTSGVLLACTMPERGFRPQPRTRGTWRSMGTTVLDGVRAVRGRPALLTFLVIAIAFGAYSEAFDRLSPYHLVTTVGLPALPGVGEAGWFGLIEAGGLALGIATTGVAARFARLEEPRALIATLAGTVTALMLLSVVFATTSLAAVAVAVLVLAQALRSVIEPLELVWVNRGLDPSTRATVLSMRGQADALGQTAGGLGLAFTAQRVSVRAALYAGVALLGVTLPLFGLVRTQQGRLDAPRDEPHA